MISKKILSIFVPTVLVPLIALSGINGPYDNNGTYAPSDAGGVGPKENSGSNSSSGGQYDNSSNNFQNSSHVVRVGQYFDPNGAIRDLNILALDIEYQEGKLTDGAFGALRELDNNPGLFGPDRKAMLNGIKGAFDSAINSSRLARVEWENAKREIKKDQYVFDRKAAEARIRAAEERLVKEDMNMNATVKAIGQFRDKVGLWKSAQLIPVFKDVWSAVAELFVPRALAAVSKKKSAAEASALSTANNMVSMAKSVTGNLRYHFEMQRLKGCYVSTSKLTNQAKCKKGKLISASVTQSPNWCTTYLPSGEPKNIFGSYGLFLSCGL